MESYYPSYPSGESFNQDPSPSYDETANDGVPAWYELRCVAAGGQSAPADALRTLALHPTRELIYAGTATGFLYAHSVSTAEPIAYARPDPVATTLDPAVRDAVVVAYGDVGTDAVITASAGGVRVLTRGCAPRASISGDGVRDAAAIAINPVDETQVCVGGGGRTLAVVDWGRECIIRQAALMGGGSGVSCADWVDLNGSGSLALFTTNTGRISVCDPRSLREVGAAAAFAGPVTSLACRGPVVAACGMGMRGSVPYLEDAVKLFDIRAMHEPIGFVPFPAGPACVSFDAWTSFAITGGDALWVMSVSGTLQCFEISGVQGAQGVIPVSNEMQLDADNDSFTTLCVSPEGLVICGDTGGFLHQWSASEYARINADSEPIWESSLGSPTTVPPFPSFRMWSPTQSGTSSTVPMSMFPVDHGMLSDQFVDAIGGDKRKQRGGGPRRGRAGVDSLGCGRPSFARFPPKVANDVIESATWHDFVAYVKAPPSFVRNSLVVAHQPASFSRSSYREHSGSPISRRHGPFASSPKTPTTSPPSLRYSSSDIAISSFSLSSPSASSESPLWMTPMGRSKYVEMDLVAWESVEGFDFLRYNQSGMFCGLENALPNVYVNAAVQALYFTPPFRDAMAHHNCEQDVCFSCELSFLFTMLDVGGAGAAIEAGNFSKAFMTMANAGALGLLDGPTALPLASRIESFTSYLLEQLHKDAGGGSNTIVSNLTGADAISFGHFSPSGTKWDRSSRPFQHVLNYDGNPSDFASLVQQTLYRELEPTRAFCATTGNFEIMSQTRKLISLPNLLLLGANNKSPDCEKWWWQGSKKKVYRRVGRGTADVGNPADEAMAAGTRLASALRLSFDSVSGELTVVDISDAGAADNVSISRSDSAVTRRVYTPYGMEEGEDGGETLGEEEEEEGSTGSSNLSAEYDLVFVIVRAAPTTRPGSSPTSSGEHVRDADGHLVLYTRVPKVYREMKAAKPGSSASNGSDLAKRHAEWWCFNDFVIAPCEQGWKEVSSFHADWKTPCIFAYVRRDIRRHIRRIERPVPMNVAEVVGPGSCNAAVGIDADEELPAAGSLVGLDCEFVMVQREDCEITGDGRRTVVSPARMALARVSVVRGYGSKAHVPLIDDYVEVKEGVVDYLTRFSGISVGDLDPNRSPYVVRQLKTVYKKLLALVDAGVIFVGHGLKKDLRVLNFAVPVHQVVDTVVLFREPGKRLLSLRFLVGTLLGSSIQTGGSDGHDSVEDSVAALKLYGCYMDLKERDCFDETLRALYAHGYSSGWKCNAGDRPFVFPQSGAA